MTAKLNAPIKRELDLNGEAAPATARNALIAPERPCAEQH